MMIIVTPTARPGLYDACLDGDYILRRPSKQPFLDTARRLLNLGHDPMTVLVMRHAGSDTDCLTAQIGAAATTGGEGGSGRARGSFHGSRFRAGSRRR